MTRLVSLDYSEKEYLLDILRVRSFVTEPKKWEVIFFRSRVTARINQADLLGEADGIILKVFAFLEEQPHGDGGDPVLLFLKVLIDRYYVTDQEQIERIKKILAKYSTKYTGAPRRQIEQTIESKMQSTSDEKLVSSANSQIVLPPVERPTVSRVRKNTTIMLGVLLEQVGKLKLHVESWGRISRTAGPEILVQVSPAYVDVVENIKEDWLDAMSDVTTYYHDTWERIKERHQNLIQNIEELRKYFAMESNSQKSLAALYDDIRNEVRTIF
jgi:hypothetical protein